MPKENISDSGHASVPKDKAPALAFDPNPEVYEQFGVTVPPKVGNAPYTGASNAIQMTEEVDLESRALLSEMLLDAKRRGFTILIFQAQTGGGSDTGGGHHLFDEVSMAASCARIVDTLQQFPMVDGWVSGSRCPQSKSRSPMFELPDVRVTRPPEPNTGNGWSGVGVRDRSAPSGPPFLLLP